MKNKSVLCVVAAASCWGLTGLFVRNLYACGLTNMQVVWLRITIALITLVPVVFAADAGKVLRIKLRHIWCFLGTGLLSLLAFSYCYFTSMKLSSLSVAAVLLYTSPAFVVILSAPLFKEKITRNKALALILTLSGCFFVSGLAGGMENFNLTALLYGLGSGFGYALYSIFGRYALQRGYSSLTITFYTFLIASAGGAFFTDIPGIWPQLTVQSTVSAILSGTLCCTIPYILYTKGLAGIENGRAAVLACIEPAVASFVSIIILHEKLTVFSAAGTVLIFLGIVIMNLKKREKKTCDSQ